MSRIAYIDGRYQPLDQPAIMVEDRGYQFADGIYEVCALRGGQFIDELAHLDRLDRSLDELKITRPMARSALRHVMRELVRRNSVLEGLLYIQVTRGVAPRDHGYSSSLKPVLVMTLRPMSAAHRAAIRKNGIQVISVPDQRWARCDIKSISLLPNVLARQSAREAQAHEAWQIDEAGFVTEGAATNAWIVDGQKNLRTRPAGPDILNGIVRQALFQLAGELGLPINETSFTLADAYAAQECFSTASTMTVFPVVSVDGKPIGDGRPGPVTGALGEKYDALIVSNKNSIVD